MHKFISGMFYACNLHPNANAAGLRGQYAGHDDGQDVNVVTPTYVLLPILFSLSLSVSLFTLHVLACSLFDVLGFGAKKMFLPNSNSSRNQ